MLMDMSNLQFGYLDGLGYLECMALILYIRNIVFMTRFSLILN